MKVHHVGYLVKTLHSSEKRLRELGFCEESPAVFDPLRRANISFWRNGGYRVELVGPEGKDSPLYPLLRKYKNTPYHLCYETAQLQSEIRRLEDLGYRLIREPEEAPCIGGRKAAFLMDPDIGIVELLEEIRGGKALMEIIGERDPIQRKALSRLAGQFAAGDWEDLDRLVRFYTEDRTMEELADAYLMFVTDTLEQTDHFARTGSYQYSTFREVEDRVYHNRMYMSKYMIGLSLSSCLWENHLRLKHWFEKELKLLKGKNYLEIGPGHGRYFCMAVNEGRFSRYDAVDISESSVLQTMRYMSCFCSNTDAGYRVMQRDFYRFAPEEPYDCLVAMEVLEHLEDPAGMLQKIVSCGREGSAVLLTVPINAPAVDHIHLFRSVKEVEDMVEKAGIEIVDRCHVTSREGITLEKAERKRFPVIAGILGRIR